MKFPECHVGILLLLYSAAISCQTHKVNVDLICALPMGDVTNLSGVARIGTKILSG
jgi:hypothetical protein